MKLSARIDLLGSLSDMPRFDIVRLDTKSLCDLIHFDNQVLGLFLNKMILEATNNFIKATNRFDWDIFFWDMPLM